MKYLLSLEVSPIWNILPWVSIILFYSIFFYCVWMISLNHSNAELKCLTELLVCIHAGDQDITGTLPSKFGNMASLEYLYIREYEWYNLIIDNIDKRKFLSSSSHNALYTENIGVTGSFPTEIGNLTNLKVFITGGCAISGPIPTQLGSLQLLTALNFGKSLFKW